MENPTQQYTEAEIQEHEDFLNCKHGHLKRA